MTICITNPAAFKAVAAVLLLASGLFLAPTLADKLPGETPKPAFIQAKEQKQWDKELAKLRAVIPADSYVDIFSKDWGPIENVKVVNIIEFMGRPYFHLVSRKGWIHFVTCDNITHVRLVPRVGLPGR
ncbi:MAG TPA: hypothetical protein VEL76_20160 [Gemmataceae bacterium]|nr:hypothetical protein [Gemmataceae bacterium]